MKKEILERYHPLMYVDLTFNIFEVSEDFGDYIQEIDVLIEHLEGLKKQGCTHTYSSLDRGFKYLSKKESLLKKIEEENRILVSLIGEYNKL